VSVAGKDVGKSDNGNTFLLHGVSLALAGPYANHLHLAADRQPCQHLITQFFAGRMLFLMPSQQFPSTAGKNPAVA